MRQRGHLSIAARRTSASRPSTPAGRVIVPGRPSHGASSRRGRGRRPPTLCVRAPSARRRGGGALGARARPALRDGPDRVVRRVGGTGRRNARRPQDRLAARRGGARGRGTARMAGDGAVQLLGSHRDGATDVLLLEACEPGAPLWSVPSAEQQDALFAGVMRRLCDRAGGGASVPAALGDVRALGGPLRAALGRVDARPGPRACGHRLYPAAPRAQLAQRAAVHGN